jgi:RNA polymerase sigma factor (sigma-70 family)
VSDELSLFTQLPIMTFPTTAWSIFEDVGSPDRAEARAALNRFIVGYWRPIYGFLRAKTRSHETAEELTQEFFLKLLEHNWLQRADASRGRFRSYLLTILTRFVADHRGQRLPKQAHFDTSLVPVSVLMRDDGKSFEPRQDESPEQEFMRRWAKSLVEEVTGELETWCRSQGRPDLYGIFKAQHFPTTETDKPTQQTIAAACRCSRDQVRYALKQTGVQFARLFRAAVTAQVDCEEDVDTEIREIEQLLSP